MRRSRPHLACALDPAGQRQSIEALARPLAELGRVNLQSIAQYGYFGPAGHVVPNQVAYFPGYPIALHVVQLVVRQWTVSGLLLSFVAGGVAVVALGRVAELDYEPGSGGRAVLYLVASPAAIFLAAGYTESLFLAFALCSWLAARRHNWMLAVLLAGGACIIRVEGLFLCAALLVEIGRRAGGQRARSLAMFVPALLPLAGYEVYLRLRTGDWLAWLHAERRAGIGISPIRSTRSVPHGPPDSAASSPRRSISCSSWRSSPCSSG